MSTHLGDDELQRRKRDARLRIGRLRRRIDARLHAAEKHSRRLISWRTYMARYPGWMLVAALGAGLAASAGLRSQRASRSIGVPLLRRALWHVRQHVWRELQRIWTESAPASSGTTPGSEPSPRATDA
jgi:hypothetical protein